MKLTDNINSWTEDKDRLILYADIMGFRDTIFSNTHADLKKRLLSFRKSFEMKIKPLRTGDYMRFVQFSDSIIIVSGAPRIYINNTIEIIKNDSEKFMTTLDVPSVTSTSVSGYSV